MMKGIRAFFGMHPAIRIALQLLLDGLPVLVMALHLLSWYSVRMLTSGWDGQYQMVPGTFFYATLFCLMIVPIPAFVAGFLWRDRAFDLFEQYRWCRWLSTALRIAGALVVSVSLLMDILMFAMWTIT